MYLADKLSLQALALEANGSGPNPGIAPGIHVRLVPSMQLGLPAAPVLVYRVELLEEEAVADGIFRTEAYLRDAEGMQVPLNQPFTNRTVRAHLGVAAEDACIHVEVQAAPGSQFEVRAYVCAGPGGMKLVGVRNSAPYALSGFGIDLVTIEGTGQITGVRWISQQSLLMTHLFPQRIYPVMPWKIWNLPAKTSKNYLGVVDPRKRARDRVVAAAPPHWPYACRLQLESMQAAADADRIANDEPLQDLLSRVLWLEDPRSEVITESVGMPVPPGGEKPRGRYRPLAQILAAATEPSVARWLGLADVDASPTNPGSLVVYVMRTFWSVDKKKLVPSTAYPEQSIFKARGEQLAQKVAKSVGEAMTGGSAWSEQAEGRRIPGTGVREILDVAKRRPGDMDVAERFIAAVVRAGAPPLPPPELRATPSVGKNWRIEPNVAEPCRVALIAVDGVVEAGALAFARTESGKPTELLNPVGPGGIQVGMVAGSPQGTGSTTSERVIVDDRCPPGKTSYKLAQRDWAGQWSAFITTLEVPAGERLAPQAPGLNVVYRPTTATDTQSSAGTFLVEVQLPRDHVPGAYPLASCNVDVVGAKGAKLTYDATNRVWTTTDTTAITTLSDDTATTRFKLQGPMLAPAMQALVKVRAVLIDTEKKETAVEQDVLAVDPRPPLIAQINTDILPTSRPDASGLAWLRVDLAQLPGVAAYHAYVTDDGVAAKVLNTLNLAQLDLQNRANTIKANADKLTRGMFELVGERMSVEKNATSFVHGVAGAHTGLILVRIVPEGSNGAAVKFEQAPLYLFAVPEARPPAQPGLAVQSITHEGSEYVVKLVVQLAAGGPAAGRVRLRRTRHAFEDALRMDIVSTTSIPTTSDLPVVLTDRIPDKAEWSTVTWVVEVQKRDDAAGTWSPPSAPAQQVILPANAPVPVTALQLSPDRKTLHIEHPTALRHPAFVLSVASNTQGAEKRPVGSLVRDATGLLWSFAQPLPPSTKLTVVVFDPRNRPSSAVTLQA